MRISDWSSDVCSSDLLPLHFRVQIIGAGGEIANDILVEDELRVGTVDDRAQSKFLMTGRAQLSDEQQIEIRFQRGCDLECDGNAATGQGQNKRMLVRKMPKSARTLLHCVLYVTKDHRPSSNHQTQSSETGRTIN